MPSRSASSRVLTSMASGYVAVEPDDVREINLLCEKSSNYLPSMIKRVEQGDGLEFKCENMARLMTDHTHLN